MASLVPDQIMSEDTNLYAQILCAPLECERSELCFLDGIGQGIGQGFGQFAAVG